MKRLVFLCFVLGALCLAGSALAQEDKSTDITKDVLAGPGNVSVTTHKDIMMSFGALLRVIPTAESNWDFGMGDDLPDSVSGYLGGNLDDSWFKNHVNEGGWVNNSYIRSEDRLYFNALPKDRKWSFYAALEFDSILDTTTVDNRGGKTDDDSNYGLERLHGTYSLPFNMRFHAGWDIWGVDVMDGGGLVYGDDNPGFWLTGDYDKLSFNVGFFKLEENNFQVEPTDLEDATDDDRSLYAGYLTYKPIKDQKIQVFYTYDRIRSVPVGGFINYVTDTMGDIPDTDSHHIGAYYTGKFGMLELFAEGVYQYGEAEDTGLVHDDYDISAYAFAGDVALELKDFAGFSLKPHAGFTYTSGDDDASDDDLEGYTGNQACQRFSQYWGGENTIIADTNFVLGTSLYGYLPEMYGNGSPVFTGGFINMQGFGNGRGDNPGMTMSSFGLSATPKKFLIFRSNVNSFWWNEDFSVTSFVDGATQTEIDSGYVGTEWDNEVTLALSKNTFVKGQFSFFFPGDGVEDVTSGLTSFAHPATGATVPGEESDDVATRIAAELIWKF